MGRPSRHPSLFYTHGTARRTVSQRAVGRRSGVLSTKVGGLLHPRERCDGEPARRLDALLLVADAANADADERVAAQHVQRAGDARARPERLVAQPTDRPRLRLAFRLAVVARPSG